MKENLHNYISKYNYNTHVHNSPEKLFLLLVEYEHHVQSCHGNSAICGKQTVGGKMGDGKKLLCHFTSQTDLEGIHAEILRDC